MSDPLQDIMEERCRQDAKWGEQNHADLYWLGILMEEVGEASRHIIEADHPERVNKMRKELIEAAAVCLAWLECLNRGKGGGA